MSNNKTFFIAKADPTVIAALNSPLLWWHNWRFLPHMKDEALSPMGFRMVDVPIASVSAGEIETVGSVVQLTRRISASNTTILDWLHHEFGLEKPGRALDPPHRLDADEFVAAVRAALPKRRKLSAADIARLKAEHRETVEPARAAAADTLVLERRLSNAVIAAYDLTPEEVALMWSTAPPRMPLDPAEELRRMGSAP